MAKEFEPNVRENFNALVHIAEYSDTPLVQQAIQNGHYGATNLEQAQKTLLSLRSTYPQLGLGLPLTESYTPKVFESLISQFKAIRAANQMLLVDLVKEAVTKNDQSLLEHFPGKIPTRQTPESIPQAPSPKETPATTPPAGEQTPSRSSQPLAGGRRTRIPVPEEIETQEPDQKEEKTEKPEPAEREQEQPQQAEQQQQQPQQTRSSRTTRPSKPPADQSTESSEEASRKEKKKRPWWRPKSQGGGGWNPFLKRLGQWGGRLARGALRGLGNLARSVMPHIGRALSALGRGALNLGGQLARGLVNGLGRGLANILPRLGAQTAFTAGRGLLGLTGPAAVAIVLNPITWVVVAITGLFAFTLWYDNFISNLDCNKQTGEMRIQKRQGGVNGLGLEARNGEQIEYIIEVTYLLACQTRILPSVVVSDKIPEGTEYVPDSATSGFDRVLGNGPTGVYDETTRTITWTFENFPASKPALLSFAVQPNEEIVDTLVMNQATVSYTVGVLIGGRILNPNSQSLEPTFVDAAQNVNMPPELLKAIAKTEAPKVFDYDEEEFQRFSVPGWWEGLEANAPTLPQNNPDIIRGYAYNTCAYRNDCASGADVRGVTQFELGTWNGIASSLQFSDGHQPDRRNATDAIYGSAILNQRNAESYTGSSNIEWTEDVVRAVARMYCGGAAAGKNPARARVSACGWNGSLGYDDFVWRDYKIFSGQP